MTGTLWVSRTTIRPLLLAMDLVMSSQAGLATCLPFSQHRCQLREEPPRRENEAWEKNP